MQLGISNSVCTHTTENMNIIEKNQRKVALKNMTTAGTKKKKKNTEFSTGK